MRLARGCFASPEDLVDVRLRAAPRRLEVGFSIAVLVSA